MLKCWRRIDEEPGLEVLRVEPAADGYAVRSTLVTGDPAYELRVDWRLDAGWTTRTLDLAVTAGGEARRRSIARPEPGRWLVDGAARPDLDGCDEVDLSVTPFCNGIAIRRFGAATLRTVYVDFPAMEPQPSLQRYEALGDRRWRYVDLGAAKGFVAELLLDGDGFVAHYEGLFEAIPAEG
jgi:hypothetical protein